MGATVIYLNNVVFCRFWGWQQVTFFHESSCWTRSSKKKNVFFSMYKSFIVLSGLLLVILLIYYFRCYSNYLDATKIVLFLLSYGLLKVSPKRTYQVCQLSFGMTLQKRLEQQFSLLPLRFFWIFFISCRIRLALSSSLMWHSSPESKYSD